MCGISGYVGKNHPSMDKMKILGMYNVTRGKDSCGIFYDGRVLKGVDKNKIFTDFIEHEDFDVSVNKKGNNTVCMIHTRQSTAGGNTEENAHPHLINNRAVIVHNGTIENIWDLCEKYDIDHSEIHNDSYALGLLIDKVGFSILSEYIGFAAILYHKLDEPNTLYFFRGASRNFSFENSPIVEERPLFILEKNNGGFYFSSMKNSLMAIRDSKDEVPFEIMPNKVYKIVNNDWLDEEINIERSWNNTFQKKTHTQCGIPKKNNRLLPSTTIITDTTTNTGTNYGERAPTLFPIINNTKKNKEKKKDVTYETIPYRVNELEKDGRDYVYFKQGRYWVGKNLAEGELLLNKYGFVESELLGGVNTFYFFRGIMLSGINAFNSIQGILKDSGNKLKGAFENHCTKEPHQNLNFAVLLSRFSKYPVVNILDESNTLPEYLRETWYHNGVMYSGGITPLFSDRNYVFKAGDLINVNNSRDKYLDVIFFSPSKKENKYINVFTATNNQNEEDDAGDEIAIGALYEYFHKTFASKQIVLNSVPETVLDSLGIYFRSILDSSSYIYTEEEISQQVEKFIEEATKDNLTFFENLPNDIGELKIKEFLLKAYKGDSSAPFNGGEFIKKNIFA